MDELLTHARIEIIETMLSKGSLITPCVYTISKNIIKWGEIMWIEVRWDGVRFCEFTWCIVSWYKLRYVYMRLSGWIWGDVSWCFKLSEVTDVCWVYVRWGQISHDDVIKWNIFRVTGPLCGEFSCDRWIPLTKASDAELWCFLWSAPE